HLEPRRRHILLFDLLHHAIDDHLPLAERQLRMLRERIALQFEQSFIDAPRHAGGRRWCRLAGAHERKELRRDRALLCNPQLAHVAAHAHDRPSRLISGHAARFIRRRPLRGRELGCSRLRVRVAMLFPQRGNRGGAIAARDVVDERDLFLLQIEQAPRIDLVTAAREVVRDHERVDVTPVLRLNGGANRDDRRPHLRLARFLRSRSRSLTGDRDRDDGEYQSLASYQLLPHRTSTASGTASGWIFSIVSFTIPATSAAPASGVSITISSWTVSNMRDLPPVSRCRRCSSAIIASFNRSAAVP